MTRLLPFPLLSAGLLALWLLLNQTLSPGQICLGGLVALVGGWLFARLGPPQTKVRRPGVIIRLCVSVMTDILRSNFAVARILLGRGNPQRSSGFVEIPLALRDPYGLAVLACIITSTPGTLWASFNPATGKLIIHVLDLIEERVWIETIKNRYEWPLREIFE
ncbi:MAG: Na+/H+ antiporter subunit E [Proteobacteria bacterium]|nr:Na+/H+ antiporter subunit E [Pseudomonadota bacterium]